MLNIFAVNITKYGSAAQRTTMVLASNVFIWVFFLFVPINGKPLETFIPLQLVGFLIILIGVLIYNEILVVPFCGFNLYTKQAIKDREGLASEERRKI